MSAVTTAAGDALDEGRTWHTTGTAAAYSGYHPTTLVRHLQSGELHGFQRKTKGRWRIHVDCLDAWLVGETCTHAAPTAKGRR
ncbi:MAG: hypothetical protein CMH83_18990 [Nocardioides sp.]|nr:hypothetical protein [Nocardioides sp.]